MHQHFDTSLNAHLTVDGKRVRSIDHRHAMWLSPERTARGTAASYLRTMASTLTMPIESLGQLHRKVDYTDPRPQGLEYRLAEEKTLFDSTTLAYWQTYANVPIWDAGVTVTVKENPSRVVAAVDRSHDTVEATLPPDRKIALYRYLLRVCCLNDRTFSDLVEQEKNEANQHLARVIGMKAKGRRSRSTKAISARQPTPIWKKGRFFLYRYDPTLRLDAPPPREPRPDGPSVKALAPIGSNQELPVYTLPLRPVPSTIRTGEYRLVVEVVFSYPTAGGEHMNWRALVDVRDDAVLYLRALTDHVNALVFDHDPISASGDNSNLPSAANAVLNTWRVDRLLANLDAPSGGNQNLSGSYGRLVDLEQRTVAAPTRPGGSDFDYDVRTDEFSAVNAYYHNDRMFALLEDLGFPLNSYMDGTTFPIDVDHRGRGNAVDMGNVVNAHCVGDGDGIDHVCYALAHGGDTANPIGIAGDWRVHLHEVYGHGILYDHVGTANFGFAHSAGDSFAAILSDPYSTAPDRFLTFPWVAIGRRHDRTPAAGWGWAGQIALNPFDVTLDRAGYNNEQILSTTLFRIYRSVGGDSTIQARRIFAARATSYLVLRAIATFSPGTNPANALAFCNALIAVDLLNWTSEGVFGGAYNKVIRWSFERQGLFQPASTATPNNDAGAPPDVDVYIDDGRAGEYDFQPVHWNTTAMWNRRSPDGGATHEEPILGETNYAYVKIKNRGTQTATNVTVRGFHTLPGAGLSWPGDFEEFSPAGGLTVASVPPNRSAEVTVGPFEWSPHVNAYGHDCMLMVVSHAADPANTDHFTAGESIPEWRLVPNDNNIAQRNVTPVPGGGGSIGLLGSMDRRIFVVRNPFRELVRIELQVRLPEILQKSGWGLRFADLPAHSFVLAPGARRVVELHVQPGREFVPEDIRALADRDIAVDVHANGILMGGMTYRLDPDLVRSVNDGAGTGHSCRSAAKDLLRCLKVDGGKVKDVWVRKVSVDVEFGDC